MAKRKLTKSVVDSIAVTARGLIVWDAVISGFAIKVSHVGKRTYFMKYRTKSGRQRKPNIGVHGAITCEQAREIAQSWSLLIANGKDPLDERDRMRASPTIKELCTRVIEDDAKPRLKPRSIEEAERLIRNVIEPKLGSLRVAEVSRTQIAKFHHELRATQPQANRALAFLSKAFNLAERWGLRPDGSNPCRHVPRYAERPRDRFLDEDELRSLMITLDRPEIAQSPFSFFIKLAIMTGRRKSELLNLMWDDVDLKNASLRLRDSKTGPQSHVLNELAVETLRSIPRKEKQVYVIAGRDLSRPAVGVQKWWQRVRAVAGIHDCNIHALRHTHASLGAAQGQTLLQIGALLGHRSAQTTMRYAHHYEASQRTSSDAIAGMIRNVTSQSK